MKQQKKSGRKSIRLKQYDYSQPGYCYITLCTYQREFLFGEILDEKMVFNELGEIVREEWLKTPIITGEFTPID